MFTIPFSQNPIFQCSIIPIVSEANYVPIIRKLGNEYLLRAIVNKFFILNKNIFPNENRTVPKITTFFIKFAV
jgi:hypothetical protein